jgi:hypothetical protein
MGQGAGRGWRESRKAEEPVMSATSGGLGILLDLDGNDQYIAQVFAQGVGYYQGTGWLIDGGGDNTFDAVWYAMGAATHEAAGIFLQSGSGKNRFRVANSMGLGAAHDGSVAMFDDKSRRSTYAIYDLGMGISLDGGVAMFSSDSDSGRFDVQSPACRALGYVSGHQPSKRGAWLPQHESQGVFRIQSMTHYLPPGCVTMERH